MIIGRWSDYKAMCDEWFPEEYSCEAGKYVKPALPEDFPTEDQILFASYGGGSYEGDAFVLFKRDDKLYEVNGSHCSCYGLEGQWKPEETTLEALRKKDRKTEENFYYYFLHDHDYPASDEYWRLIDSLVEAA